MVASNQSSKGALPATIELLLWDDDPIFTKKMDRTCKVAGVAITTVTSLAEFGAMMRTKTFDLIILDYFLAEVRGTEVAAALAGPPVILTSWHFDSFVDQYLPPGVEQFVHKKFGTQFLLAIGQKILGHGGG